MFYSRQSLYLLQFLHFSSGVLSQSTNAPPASRQSSTEYEYVVVGSGAGGGPLAARLALNGRKVLLVEAGDDSTGESLNQTVPVFHPYATEDPDMSWDFFVKHYADEGRAKTDSKMVWNTPSGGSFVGLNPPSGSKQKGILYPRSATLGGCTAHNAMVNVYPHASDWINIVNITGDTTWNPDNMRKLYQKMEKVDYVPNGTAGHGFDGWLGTSKPPVTLAGTDSTLITIGTESAKQISKNAEEEGMNVQRVVEGDMNEWTPKRDQIEGSWLIPLAINSGVPGKRAGSRDFILSVFNAKTDTGAKKFPLDIAMNTLVTKVIFDSKVTKGKPRATGVEFLKGKAIYKADPRWRKNEKEQGTKGQVFASKEVILSGGAYNTPQLLKLSGIGPRDELEKFKIPVKVDLPGVGTNLQDHNEIAVTHEAIEPFQVVEGCTYGEAGDPCLDRWRKGEGVYGASNGFIYGIIKKSTVAHLDTVYGNDPDIFLFGGIAAFRGYYPRYSREVYGHKSWTWVILRAHTSNTAGTVKLTSADPLDTPEIVFNYFDTGSAGAGARDLAAMSEAINLARKISTNVQTDPKQGPILTKETNPGPNILSNSTAMMDYIKAESWSHHASCTCPIGSDKDPNAVLDSKFRVRGVDGLRIVDASVFPRIPGFFIAAPTYMIAEKAAESILTGN